MTAFDTFEGSIARAYEAAGVGTVQTHAVQFYEEDAFLVASVGDYLAAGLAKGQPVIAVATPEHLDGIRQHLISRGFDVDRAALHGQLTLADAHAVLATFMDGPMPNAERCRAAVGGMLREHTQRIPRTTVRVFGEMVDVLSRAGHIDGAIALEGLWNELAHTHRFSLLCGYSMRTFMHDSHTASVASICRQHAHVIPTERYFEVAESDRLREITMLQQRARALETEVERREELEHSLRIALKKAESANRAKNQFLALMSHELRTPLNAIGGHVQLVEMELLGPINEQQRDALGRVQRSQRQLLSVINDVLNLARLEATQVHYAAEAVPVTELIAEVATLLEPLFVAGGLSCVVECGETSLVARGDSEKVRQILHNLLDNAIKFTPAGGRITVRAEASARSAGEVEIHVCDTGIGMPREKLSEIFEPFVQISAGPAGSREGVGLGLSISRTLARGMAGDLTAESDPRCGSSFVLRRPAFRA